MAAPQPRGPHPLVPVTALIGFGLGVMLFPPAPARAADSDFTITGYRLEMRACQGPVCRILGASRTPWRKRQACLQRLDQIVEGIKAGALKPPALLAGQSQIQARCAPVLELRSA